MTLKQRHQLIKFNLIQLASQTDTPLEQRAELLYDTQAFIAHLTVYIEARLLEKRKHQTPTQNPPDTVITEKPQPPSPPTEKLKPKK